MNRIIKAKETMTSKERIRRTFAFEKTDRVAIGYDTNPIAHKKLCAALGMDPDDRMAFYKLIGVDNMGARISYKGPIIYPEIPNRKKND
jgi:hypothetical protein